MNYSTAIFLINTHVRAILATYEEGESATRTLFKTLNEDIGVGDFVVVPTESRHHMTVCKVVETDVDVDFEDATSVKWIIGRVDAAEYEQTLEQEAKAIQAIKSAEMRKKREDLRAAMFADHIDTLKALPIAAINGNGTEEPAEGGPES